MRAVLYQKVERTGIENNDWKLTLSD